MPIPSSTIVLDIGSQNFYAGYAGEKLQSGPTIVGRTNKFPYVKIPPSTLHDCYYGNEVVEDFAIGLLSCSKPVMNSSWTDVNHMENFIDYLLDAELDGADPEKNSFILTEPGMHPHMNIERKAEIMFEKFNIPYLLVENMNWLSLLGYGKTRGVVLSVGAGVTQVSPFVEHSNLTYHEQSSDFGGIDITEAAVRLLNNCNLLDRSCYTTSGNNSSVKYNFQSIPDFMIVDDIKEKLGRVNSSGIGSIVDSTYKESTKYELPDGFMVDIYERDRDLIGEALFNCEEITGRDVTPVHELIHDVIQNCDIHVRRDLYSNILLCGGSTKMAGFDERLKRELLRLAPGVVDVNIVSGPERTHTVYDGASVLAQLSIFREIGVTGDDYDEYGPVCAVDAFMNWHY